MSKKQSTGLPVEVLAGRLEQAGRLEARHAGHVAALEGRKVTLAEEEGALVDRMRRGGDVGRELGKVREAFRDLEEELKQALRIHADLKADVAGLEAEHADAERRAKLARAPVVADQVVERLAGLAGQIQAVLLEVRTALEAEIVPAAANAQTLWREAFATENTRVQRTLRTLQHVVQEGLRVLEEGGAR